MSIHTHSQSCTHLPMGIHMILLMCMQKIHCVFLFVNRKHFYLCPDKGSYSKHMTKLCLQLCSSYKLISTSPYTCSCGSGCWRCRNAKANTGCCWPPAASPIWRTVHRKLQPSLSRMCLIAELLPATRCVSPWETGRWSNGARLSAARAAVLHPKQVCSQQVLH